MPRLEHAGEGLKQVWRDSWGFPDTWADMPRIMRARLIVLLLFFVFTFVLIGVMIGVAAAIGSVQ